MAAIILNSWAVTSYSLLAREKRLDDLLLEIGRQRKLNLPCSLNIVIFINSDILNKDEP